MPIREELFKVQQLQHMYICQDVTQLRPDKTAKFS